MALTAADIYNEAFDQGLRPDPRLTVSEWADGHRVLSPRASAEPGRYRTSRTPRLRANMDCLSIRKSSKTRDIVLDPFGGSGNKVIAFEKTNRQARLG